MDHSDSSQAFLTRHGMSPELIDPADTIPAFLDDMLAGLAGRAGSLRMIPTYLTAEGTLPLGVPAAVIDAGGTNFRTALVTFTKSGPVIEDYALSPMPGSEGPVSWDAFIAFTAKRVLPLLDRAKAVGFCFSYPTDATPDRDGTLITLTKQVSIENFRGRLLCADLRARLSELGAGELAITLLNDTPAVLLSGASPICAGGFDGLVGLISGTGTNTCCELPVSAIPKLGSGFSGSMLVNLESGGFARLPRGDFDEELDKATADPGAYRHEKMTAGAYVGELCRLTLRGAAREGLFSPCASEKLLALSALSATGADRLAACPAECEFGSERDALQAMALCGAIFDRAARCVAANLAAILLLTDTGRSPGRPACICADGSLFTKSRVFRPMLEKYMGSFASSAFGRSAVFRTADNATMLGSAAAALLNI